MPSLILGAAWGGLFGLVVRDLLPHWNVQPGLYAVLAATGVLGGVFRSAISLVVLVVEGTHGKGKNKEKRGGERKRRGKKEKKGKLKKRRKKNIRALPTHLPPLYLPACPFTTLRFTDLSTYQPTSLPIPLTFSPPVCTANTHRM